MTNDVDVVQLNTNALIKKRNTDKKMNVGRFFDIELRTVSSIIIEIVKKIWPAPL